MSEDQRTRTLTLQVLFDALKANVGRCADNQDAQEGLNVMAQLTFLTQAEQYGLYECPEKCHRYEEDPEADEAALKVKAHGRAIASSKSLGTEGV